MMRDQHTYCAGTAQVIPGSCTQCAQEPRRRDGAESAAADKSTLIADASVRARTVRRVRHEKPVL